MGGAGGAVAADRAVAAEEAASVPLSGCTRGRRACGSGCMSCCSPSCTPVISWNGSGRSLIPATCRRKKGRENGSQSGRPGPSRQQAPPARRRGWCPARLDAHRRQPQRRHLTARVARPGAARARPDRSRTTQTADADRRPRLRLRQVPAARLAARHQADHRPPPDRARLPPRPPPLGRRTKLRLAAKPPPTRDPHRPRRRHPRGLPRPRLLPRLLAAAGELNP